MTQPIYYWGIVAVDDPPGDYECLTHTTEEAATEDEARQQFAAKRPNGRLKIKSITRGNEKFVRDEQLLAWLKENKVTLDEARVAVQVMVLNTREPDPCICPKCGKDIDRAGGPNKVGNAYYCPYKRCKFVLQVG